MKIVHALGWYFPESLGGTEVYVAGLSERLKTLAYDVTVAAPCAGGLPEREYQHGRVSVYRYGTPEVPTKNECQGRVTVRGAERFHAWLKKQRPDWVHFHTFSTGLNIPELEAARTAGARLIATNHLASLGFLCQRGTLMRWGERLCDGICKPIKCAECELQNRGLPKNGARIVARAGDLLSRLPNKDIPGSVGSALLMPDLIRRNLAAQSRMLELVDWFVLLNRWAFEAVAANGAPRDKLVLNYLGTSSFAQARKLGAETNPTRFPVRLGYFGRIVKIKGVIELACAFSRLPRDLPVTLEFRGPSDNSEASQLIVHLREITEGDGRVSFAPSVTPAEASGVLASYDLLCIPSVWFENGPTVMSEAHAAGTPVLGTNIGAMPEIITDGVNGRLVAPGDIGELAAAIEQIVRDPAGTIDKWRRQLPKARTMNDIADDYVRLYES